MEYFRYRPCLLHIFITLLLCNLVLLYQSYCSENLWRVLSNRRFNDVKTNLGTVRGWAGEDGDYFAYLGIPYAAPPLGKNRFKAPLSPIYWQGILYANREVKCPQRGTGDEDCLVLNVFTPTITITQPLPVLVYIHGGSFLLGKGQARGVEVLIEQNIIVVTLNYRLGVLGFLCLGVERAPGNAGLKDQLAALKWVQNNVHEFGGDPKDVTLYGMSAGSASVEFHVLSEVSKGLFKKAIMESGSAMSVFSLDVTPRKTAVDLAKLANFTGDVNNIGDLIKFYQKIPADVLSKINYEYYYNFSDGNFGFVPCVENKKIKDAFLVESPDKVEIKHTKTVPMLVMFTSLEGLYLFSEKYYECNYKKKMELNFGEFLPADLKLADLKTKRNVADRVKHFYFGNEEIGDGNMEGFLNYFGDYLILHSLIESVKRYSKDGNIVYLMEFAYKGNMGSYEKFYENMKSAGHGDIVKHAILLRKVENENDNLAVNNVVKIITNFMKYGNPSETLNLLPNSWKPVKSQALSNSDLVYLFMNQTLEVRHDPYPERMHFWDQLYAKYR